MKKIIKTKKLTLFITLSMLCSTINTSYGGEGDVIAGIFITAFGAIAISYYAIIFEVEQYKKHTTITDEKTLFTLVRAARAIRRKAISNLKKQKEELETLNIKLALKQEELQPSNSIPFKAMQSSEEKNEKIELINKEIKEWAQKPVWEIKEIKEWEKRPWPVIRKKLTEEINKWERSLRENN